jgi:hypothetical protein
MFFADTKDARGIRQWNKVNRYVKKGSKGFYILVPNIKKIEDEEAGEERKVLVGFLARPVFRYEDTDGEPLEYEQVVKGDIGFKTTYVLKLISYEWYWVVLYAIRFLFRPQQYLYQ